MAEPPPRAWPYPVLALVSAGFAGRALAAPAAEGGEGVTVSLALLGLLSALYFLVRARRSRKAIPSSAPAPSVRPGPQRQDVDAGSIPETAARTDFAQTAVESQPLPLREAPSETAPPHAALQAGVRRPGAAPPRRIGHYIVERDIGRGAMGMVLLCSDERGGSQVALKTMALSREFHGEQLQEARERFFREAEMASRLQHPDIVRVLEAGEDAGMAFIAMELLSGRDLSEHAEPDELLPVPQVLEIVARVAKALAYAHRQGVTHRDIKPANIMVDIVSGAVKVTDFGIARITDSTQTRTGLVLGTPSFMSPEQMAGGRVDGRSDIYSLGVTLFQLLTGALPHQGSMVKLIRAIASEPAPDIRTLRPGLPQALADVVALALAKHPDLRYANGDALAGDLRAVAALMVAAPRAGGPPAIPPDPHRGAAPAGGAGAQSRARS